MISLYSIKPKFQQLLKPLLGFLYKKGVTANMITWCAILLSAATGALMWIHPYGKMFLLLPLSLLLRMALNALDGMMARTYDMQSKKGEILNELGDVVSDFLMFFPLFKLFSLRMEILIAFLFMSLVNEYAGILGKAIVGIRQYDGPMGKSDRAFVIGFLSLVFYFTTKIESYMDSIFIVITFLLVLSTYFRIKKTLNHK
jgi:CDP-diacylglycerol---glycerol-3-phosphate 3-phosphatidyltransferase